MYDCRAQGGHFFVHTPQLSSFTCRRCKSIFPNYNPRVHQPSYTEPKMPWRCLLENCGFIACKSCAESLQLELKRVHELREGAERRGVSANACEDDKASSENGDDTAGLSDPEISRSSTREKRSGGTVSGPTGGGGAAGNGLKSSAEKMIRPGQYSLHRRIDSGNSHTNNNNNNVETAESANSTGAKLETVGTTVVTSLQNTIEVDEDMDEEDFSFTPSRRVFLRSAAMASAEAMKNVQGRSRFRRAGDFRERMG